MTRPYEPVSLFDNSSPFFTFCATAPLRTSPSDSFYDLSVNPAFNFAIGYRGPTQYGLPEAPNLF